LETISAALNNSGIKLLYFQTTQEHVNRLYPLAQQLQSVGYLESGQLYQRTADVKRQVEELLINLNTRGQLLSASLHFFRMAATVSANE